MNRSDFHIFLRAPYNRESWLEYLHELLPGTQIFAKPAHLSFLDEQARKAIVSAEQLARIELADGRKVAVIEVKVSGQVDLQRNRVGLRQLLARFIDHEQADAVLGFFRGDTADYRLSCVARTNEIGKDGHPRRVVRGDGGAVRRTKITFVERKMWSE